MTQTPAKICPLYQIALIGNPNCGKTTLFNRLTGAQQTTGNWPGVTVEQKFGSFKVGDKHFNLIDLPGVYSLDNSALAGLDEKVACQYLQNQTPDLILNVVDATSLERQLYLTAHLLHMGLPVLVVVNRMDLLKAHNLEIDLDALAHNLGCPVVAVSSYFNQGIDNLKEAIPQYLAPPEKQGMKIHTQVELPKAVQAAIQRLRQIAGNQNANDWKLLQSLIEPKSAPEWMQAPAQAESNQLQAHYQEDVALIAADSYFQFAHNASHNSLTRTDKFTRNTTDSIDQWALHPFLGLPIFFSIMYLLFSLSVVLGNTFIDFFSLTAQALFVDQPKYLMQQVSLPDWSIALIADGLGGGLQVVTTFIPVIGALFLFLSLIEETGYMQRAALLMDRFMRKLGLSGQAFVPLVVSFGCNVPSVSATRTLPDARDRILTIMMTPFMSCSARLTVYVLFASAFFSNSAALIVFSLYMLGIAAAIFTALLLKKTLLPGEAPPLLMELPNYHKPTLMNVLINTRNKLKGFILDAGKIIILVVLVLNFFNSLGTDGTFGHQNQPTSMLSSAAKQLTPLVSPLGIEDDNWPATVGIITGLLAKEVVVGSLDALYQNQPAPKIDQTAPPYELSTALNKAVSSIARNFSHIFSSLTDPIDLNRINSSATATQLQTQSSDTRQKMAQNFGSPTAAYAYLILILLYFPCVATFGAIQKELGWRWALYSGGWSLFLGYSTAVIFYQTATLAQHPTQTTIWISCIILVYILLYFSLKRIGLKTTRHKM